jgi:quercetin dioxygenase-like cupin family protein
VDYFIDWRSHSGASPEKFFKATLWHGEHMMVGLNCLEPSQEQATHAHTGADKIYYVLEGAGQFVIGDHVQEAEAGVIVVAPAGIQHGVKNAGAKRLVLLVAIAPPTGK